MNSIFGKKQSSKVVEDPIRSPLLDLQQPTASEHDKSDRKSPSASALANLPLQSNFGNAAVSRTLIQRKAEGEEVSGVANAVPETDAASTGEQTSAPASVPTSLIVEDSADTVGPGQMRKSQFLTQLRNSVSSMTADVLADTPFSGAANAYIERWFTSYASKSSAQIERAIRRYAPEACAETSASSLVSLLTQRVRRSLITWVGTGELGGMLGEATSFPGASALAAVGEAVSGAVSGAVSATAKAASKVVSGVGSALSALGGLFFKSRDGGANEDAEPEAVQARLGSGQSLDAGVRSRMEAAFGEGFGDVQVHADTNAAGLSENLNARAFTVGQHIAFGTGEYQPGTLVGDALIAHELAHVSQQRGATGSGLAQKSANDYGALEADADQVAVAAVVSSWGGARKGLARIATNGLPSLKSGLRLQRCEDKKKAPPAKEPIPADPHAVYEQKLNEAVDLLTRAGFGLAHKTEKYDKEFWVVRKDPEFGKRLSLRPGKRPSDAIDAMFDPERLKKWSVDCAQFVQIAEWYALRHAFGADEFNYKTKNLQFRLRPHRSTLLEYTEWYERASASDPMIRQSDKQIEPRSVDQLLADAPIGSRITWRNIKAPKTSPYYHENTIKLGDDLFAAHGFPPQNKFNRKDLEKKLAQAEDKTADDEYVKANIFLHEIGFFNTP